MTKDLQIGEFVYEDDHRTSAHSEWEEREIEGRESEKKHRRFPRKEVCMTFHSKGYPECQA